VVKQKISASSALILDDKNDPFRAGAGTVTGSFFLARRYVKPLNRDVTGVVERIKLLGNRMAARISHAFGFFYDDFHPCLLTFAADRTAAGFPVSPVLTLKPALPSIGKTENRRSDAKADDQRLNASLEKTETPSFFY